MREHPRGPPPLPETRILVGADERGALIVEALPAAREAFLVTPLARTTEPSLFGGCCGSGDEEGRLPA